MPTNGMHLKIQLPMLPQELETPAEADTFFREAAADERKITSLRFAHMTLSAQSANAISFLQVHFDHCTFTDCDFSACGFRDVLFSGCAFSGCDFSDAAFTRCRLESCQGLGANYTGCGFAHFSVQGSNLHYANFTNAKFENCLLRQSDFGESYLGECTLRNFQLYEVRFDGAEFFKTPLRGVDLTRCTVDGIGVSDTGSELRGAIVDIYQAARLAKLLGLVIKED